MKNALQNFQIPVFSFDRALSFYSALIGYDLMVLELPEYKLGVFNFDQEGGVGGVIISGSEAKPSKDGTTMSIYIVAKIYQRTWLMLKKRVVKSMFLSQS